jgi:hypothetical protein
MPCYRCGTRQVDPDRGESPWKRGVRRERQVLVCPGCQDAFDWTSDLDRCRVCGSVHLLMRLGEVECRDCGNVRAPVTPGHLAAPGHLTGPGPADPVPAADSAAQASAAEADLAREVELALARVLGRTAGSAAGG